MKPKSFTRSEAIKKHRIMWNWIAQSCIQEQRKVMDYEAYYHFQWYDICGLDPLCNFNINNSCCDDCPLIWPGNQCISYKINSKEKLELDGLLHDYLSSKNHVEAARIAYQIANLPERSPNDSKVFH